MLAQLLLVAGWPLLVMQSPGDCESDAKPERAAPNVRQDVETILDEWQRREPSFQCALVEFGYYKYDEAFGVEKRGRGELNFKPCMAYSWIIQPSKIAEGASSKRSTSNGGRFAIEAAQQQAIYFDRRKILQLDHRAKRYAVLNVPPQFQDVWSWELAISRPVKDSQEPLSKWQRELAAQVKRQLAPVTAGMRLRSYVAVYASLLSGTNIEQLRESFEWSFSKTTRDGFLSLSARPANAKQGTQFQRIDLLLAPGSYVTKGVRIVDPAKSTSTVLVPEFVKFDMCFGAVQSPSLKGYQLQTDSTQVSKQPADNSEKKSNQVWGPILASAMVLWMLIL